MSEVWSAVGRIEALTIDCADPTPLADFYRNALGGEIVEQDGDGAILTGDTWTLVFRRVDNFRAPRWPEEAREMQMHLEIAVRDLAEAQKRLVLAGAIKCDFQPSDNKRLTVMLDPAGHPFCIGEV